MSSFQKDLQCEYSPFALEVIFVQGFLAAKPGFVLNLAGGGTIYRLYRVPLQKMGNVMSPELGKDLLPNLEVIAACQCPNNQQIFDILEVKFPDEYY